MKILQLQEKLFIKSLENHKNEGCFLQDIHCPANIAINLKPLFAVATNTKVIPNNVYSNENGIFQIITIESSNEENLDFYFKEITSYIEEEKEELKKHRETASGRYEVKATIIHINKEFNTKYGLKKHVLLKSVNDLYIGIISEKNFKIFDETDKVVKVKMSVKNIKENLNNFTRLTVL